ncbi:MAG: hypothetical protein D6704_02750 [Nitrospirae bacterium]|nr:MAG: hypothetical protein D6704_02750 [Nitrospirota bacterium]
MCFYKIGWGGILSRLCAPSITLGTMLVVKPQVMPPVIHPVDLVQTLRHKRLTPAIVFLTSRRACDEAIDSFEHRNVPLPAHRSRTIAQVLDHVIRLYPSVAQHPLLPTVQRYGVAAHHAGHLPSWKIAVEELMRHGCLDAVFATTTLAAGVDFPARTVVITQSSVRKARDLTELTVSEIQQLSGRGGRRGKDLVGFVVVTPSPYIDLHVITRGLTGNPEPIHSQFVISYPMVLNLLKAHTLDHIKSILEKSFAQFQLNQQATALEEKLETVEAQLAAFGPRPCADWITQWHWFNLAQTHRRPRHAICQDAPPILARLPFLTPGRVVGLPKGRGVVLRRYRSRSQHRAMLTVLNTQERIIECPVAQVTEIYDHTLNIEPARVFPWCTPKSLQRLMREVRELPQHLQGFPLPEDTGNDSVMLPEPLTDEFPCPMCPSQPACRKDYTKAWRLRQEHQQLTKTIHAIRSQLWHRFQQHVEVLQQFGYLTATCQLTADGEWARLIRINHSLLLTELIRMDAFTGIEPALLVGVLASIAHEDDRPGIFPRRSPALASVLGQVRTVAHSLASYEDPPLLRSDVAALGELWISQPSLSWGEFVRTTTMAEGDVYRLLARTLEYVSQLHNLKATHPGLADIADQAMQLMRRDVLQELP